MDPLSVMASVAALAQCTSVLISFTQDCIKARKERESFIEELRNILFMVKQLENHYRASNKEDPWYQRLRQMGETCGTLTPEGKYTPPPDRTKKATGPLDKLYRIIAELHTELHADQPSHGWREKYERLKWFWDKGRLAKMLAEIAENCAAISMILDFDHFEASKAAAISSKAAEISLRETAECVRLQADHVTDIGIRIKTLEDNSIEQRKKEEEEEDEREKETMIKWLSPTLDFLARQKDLYEKNWFESAGQWLLDHDIFQRWTLGQSWYLRCLGEPGAGKVGVFEHITSTTRF